MPKKSLAQIDVEDVEDGLMDIRLMSGNLTDSLWDKDEKMNDLIAIIEGVKSNLESGRISDIASSSVLKELLRLAEESVDELDEARTKIQDINAAAEQVHSRFKNKLYQMR